MDHQHNTPLDSPPDDKDSREQSPPTNISDLHTQEHVASPSPLDRATGSTPTYASTNNPATLDKDGRISTTGPPGSSQGVSQGFQTHVPTDAQANSGSSTSSTCTHDGDTLAGNDHDGNPPKGGPSWQKKAGQSVFGNALLKKPVDYFRNKTQTTKRNNQDGRNTPTPPPSEPDTIVFFGTTGVGKSSVINMLPDAEANAPQAPVSNSSSGVTTDARSYSKVIGERHFRIYDTAGIGEGATGTVPTHEAIKRFYDVLKGHRILLIVFVIRGGRLTKMEENNHRLIKLLAPPEIPIALVITGLEYEEDMDGWWDKQSDQRAKYDFAVDYHAPVVATRGKGNMLGPQYDESRDKIQKLLSEATKDRVGIMVGEKSWFTAFHKEVRAIIDDSGLGRGRIFDFSEEIRKLLKKYQDKENGKSIIKFSFKSPSSKLDESR